MQAEDWSDSEVFLVMLGSLLETENPLDPSAMPPLNSPTPTFLPCPGLAAFLGYLYLSFYLGNLSFSHLLASDILPSASAERSAGHISRLLEALAAVLKRKYRRLFWVFPGMATASAILFVTISSSTPVLSLA